MFVYVDVHVLVYVYVRAYWISYKMYSFYSVFLTASQSKTCLKSTAQHTEDLSVYFLTRLPMSKQV